jgi:hypothetical protein
MNHITAPPKAKPLLRIWKLSLPLWNPLLSLLLWYGETMFLWKWSANSSFFHDPYHIYVTMDSDWIIATGKTTTIPNVTFATKNLTWNFLGAKRVLRGEKLATNHLSYGTALWSPNFIAHVHKNPRMIFSLSFPVHSSQTCILLDLHTTGQYTALVPEIAL